MRLVCKYWNMLVSDILRHRNVAVIPCDARIFEKSSETMLSRYSNLSKLTLDLIPANKRMFFQRYIYIYAISDTYLHLVRSPRCLV